MRVLCSSILISEALVIGFALLVAKDLTDVNDSLLYTVGGAGAFLCLLIAGMLRHRWAYVAGSLLQVGVLASGFVVPTMFVLGGIFGALWVLAIYLGRRVVRLRAAHAALAAERGADPATDRVPGRASN